MKAQRLLLLLGLGGVLFIGLYVCIYRPRIYRANSSMAPVLKDNQLVFSSPRFKHPVSKGELVELVLPPGGVRTFRVVVGVPGDRYENTSRGLVIDGVFYEAVPGESSLYPENFTRGVLDANSYITISASKDGIDSRRIGPVDASSIMGIVIYPRRANHNIKLLVPWAKDEPNGQADEVAPLVVKPAEETPAPR